MAKSNAIETNGRWKHTSLLPSVDATGVGSYGRTAAPFGGAGDQRKCEAAKRSRDRSDPGGAVCGTIRAALELSISCHSGMNEIQPEPWSDPPQSHAENARAVCR